MVWVFNRENVVTEAWNHEKLLVKGVHIADTAEVLDANATSRALLFFPQLDVPVTVTICSPTWV